jgi:hypothetical protein
MTHLARWRRHALLATGAIVAAAAVAASVGTGFGDADTAVRLASAATGGAAVGTESSGDSLTSPSDASTSSSDEGSTVECEDETGVTPGPCPAPPGPGVDGVAGGSEPPSAPSGSEPGEPVAGAQTSPFVLAGPARVTIRFSADPRGVGQERYTVEAANSPRFTWNVTRGGKVYKYVLTGEGGLREHPVPQDAGRQITLGTNVSNCKDFTVKRGTVRVFHGRDEAPGLGVTAVFTGPQTRPGTTFLGPINPPWTVEFTCDVR